MAGVIPAAINQASDCQLTRFESSEHLRDSNNTNEITPAAITPPKSAVTSHSTVTLVTVPKRGRGRPRKEPQTLAEEVRPKRKRGRPRKPQQVVAEPLVKRKRGRPRKTVKNSDLPTDTDSNSRRRSNAVVLSSLIKIAAFRTDRQLAPIFGNQPRRVSHISCPPTMSNSAADDSAIDVERIVPKYDPLRPLDNDSPDNEDDEGTGDDGDGHAAPEDDEDRDLPAGIRPPPSWLMDAFQTNLQVVKAAVVGHGAGVKVTIYDQLKSFWLPHVDTFFLLQQRDISPSLLYNPRFFYWDPLALVDRLSCPQSQCVGSLTRHGYWRRPRRIVDLEDVYWLMGVRYKCNCCSGTYQSWDSRVLSRLPEPLAAQFPAHLTHRSGMSDSVFTIMRCCFQNGMGAKQFSDSLRVMHRRHYEMLEVQYLQTIQARAKGSALFNQIFEPFPAFDEKNDRGLNTIVPSAQWCRDIYDNFIESHEHEYHQHTAMLSSEVMAIDHSFKICKHIAKIAGQTVFSGLLTMTNEFGQIRVCDLVPTKAHSQFTIALTRMRHSLETYGLAQPRIIFTDTMADKNFLETAFPSLRTGVRPIAEHGNLETLELPSHVQVHVQKSTTQIESTILSLIDSMPDEEDSVLVVGLDSEWSVDLDARRLGQNDRRQNAILQLAYGDKVWIFQLSEHIRAGHFPSQLITFLKNPRILKVGRNVKLDLQNLQEESGVAKPFPGGIDVAHLAKQKGIVKNARIGLADLCAKVLKVHLDKDPATRVSPDWDSEELSPEQLRYAALDAWASLRVYEELEKMKVPGALISFTPGCDVFLYQEDNNIIAQGHISLHSDYQSFEGINITATRILVEVTKVFVPGAIISTHRKQALSEFGSCPFTVVSLRSRLKTYIPGFSGLDTLTEELPIHSTPEQSDLIAGSSNNTALSNTEVSNGEFDQPFASEEENREAGTDTKFGPEQGGRSFERLIIDFCDILASEREDSSEEGDLDAESVRKCEEILEELKKIPWPNDRRSGVLKDIFHVFQMIWIPKSHGLRITFARILRDAIFLPDRHDKKVMISYLARLSPPMTWKECLRKDPGFIKKHCKFVVPPPEVLYDLVAKLFKTYGPLKDAQTGLPLFNASTWKTARNILVLIRSGYISDPPGVPLYLCLGVESNGLPHYRCFRGTNYTEGGVHRPIRHSLPISGVSPRHTSNRLTAFVYYHNITVGTYNSTGQRYKGHFDVWLTNKRQALLNSEIIHSKVPASRPVAGWINGDLYTPTTEVFGILPIPANVQLSSAITTFNPANPPKKFQYLARKQDTRFAVLTVHTAEEKQFFSDCMMNEPSFTAAPDSDPVWLDSVKIWNNHADGETIFYKLIEHLKTYYTTWKSAMNAKHTMIATYNKRRPIDRLIRNVDTRVHNAPSVPQRPSLSQPIPSSGLNPQPQTPETSEPCIQYPSVQLPSQTTANQSRGTAPRKRTTPDSQEGSMTRTGLEGFERPESETVEGPSRKRSGSRTARTAAVTVVDLTVSAGTVEIRSKGAQQGKKSHVVASTYNFRDIVAIVAIGSGESP